ncbi:hypothetical protein [Bradyrhizobium sp.]|uniref:hypothetical protein n=1 Tax=Bradyrhizobium sp. TaxID=376 RepID=UPI0025C126DA|nr:hypothetical protein [Bradyrhizobium sp.]
MSLTHPSSIPLRPALAAVKMKCLRLIHMACDTYRPELHYMRGPGPKWHAKHLTGRSTFSTHGA